MRRLIFAVLTALCGTAALAAAAADTPSRRYALPAPAAAVRTEVAGVDRAKELAADVGTPKSRPLRYAVTRAVQNVAFSKNTQSGGEWRDLPDGMTLWRVPVHAAGARTLDFGFRRMFLPPGAQLFLSNGQHRLGPYSDADNTRSGEFWTPLLYGEDALIELLLPKTMKPHLVLELGTVHVGYRDIFAPSQAKSFADPNEGSGSCNLDTICAQGDPWRNEINAEAILVFDGGFCSGQLLNDTRNDRIPYLSTANHCISTDSDARSLVVYWKYESPVCRAPFSAASAEPVPTDDAIAQTGGADLVMTYEPADFTLVKLLTTPPAAAHVYWNGWDRSETPFSNAVVMHHPEADSKRISFTGGTVTVEDDAGFANLPGQHHWYVDHYAVGTTEEGSSGSGLIDANHHLRGVLSGGEAFCTNLAGEDYYGRLSSAWLGGGTPGSRLSDWLDPGNSGVISVDGIGVQVTPLAVTLASSAPSVLAGQGVTLTAAASGGVSPYTYAFDLDGDGVADNLDPNAASVLASYPGAFSGNVSVIVTDASGAHASATQALVVTAQSLVYQSQNPFGAPTDAAVALCGGTEGGAANPGARLQSQVQLVNRGSAPTSNGYAVFAPDAGNAAKLTLETPALAVPALAPGESTTLNVTFAVPTDAVCGQPLKVDYLGTADDHGFTANPATIASFILAPSDQCAAVTSCPAQVTPIVPKRGNFFDPTRAGSGVTQVVQPQASGPSVFFGAWFTGDDQRQPTWYIVNDAVLGNQVNSTLFLTHLSAPNTFPETGSSVGSAQISIVSPTKFVFTWTLNGKPGGGVYIPVSNDPQSSLRSWFNTNESGWGTFDELFPASGSGGNPNLFNLDFLYDNAGNPRWTTASDGSYVDGHTLTEMVARPSCPACVWLDYTIGAQSVGTQSYGNANGSETISTNFTFPSAYPGTWVRHDLPLTPLVPPQ